MEDVHMETPPVSSDSRPDPLAAAVAAAVATLIEQSEAPSAEHASKADVIRSSLGQSVVSDFGIYRDILEEHHERRERIIKVSRDINNFSKKMIFALHRAEPKDYLPQFSASSEALIEFKEKHATVLKLFHRIAIDLQDSNYHRYQRSVSGAMQEYIEAMTLEYFLVHGKLMPKSALEVDLVFMTTPEQLSNPDLIIGIGQATSGGGGGGIGGGGGGGGGPRGKFNKDNRKAPYNKDNRRDHGKKSGNTPSIENPSAAAAPATTVTNSTASTSETSSQASSMAVEGDETNASTPPAPFATNTPVRELPELAKLTLEVTDEDYLLGIADLTGELMRLAINTLGQSLMAPVAQEEDAMGGHALPTPEERVQEILLFLRNIKSGFDGLALTRMSPVSKKMGVLRQSLNKIEMACYNVKVRGAEYPPDILRQMLMSGGSGGGDNGGGVEGGNEDEE